MSSHLESRGRLTVGEASCKSALDIFGVGKLLLGGFVPDKDDDEVLRLAVIGGSSQRLCD
jgi:hypothetical protein